MQAQQAATLLREHGMRATAHRTQVLLFVEAQKHPIGIEVLQKTFPEINEVTLYRMASDFIEKGIWNTCELGHGHTDFESANRSHHHHIVCEACGDIEEVYSCKEKCRIIDALSNNTKKFHSLKPFSTAIFGTCNDCAAPAS